MESAETTWGSQGNYIKLNIIIAPRLSLTIHSLVEELLIAEGCPDLCYAAVLNGSGCEQESTCIEHFNNASISCECKNSFTMYGERCEMSKLLS